MKVIKLLEDGRIALVELSSVYNKYKRQSSDKDHKLTPFEFVAAS